MTAPSSVPAASPVVGHSAPGANLPAPGATNANEVTTASAHGTTGRWHRDWLDVAARDVVVGDVYANGASVTEVVHGPRRSDGWDNVGANEVLIRCGESFSTKGKASRRVIVGRNARFVWDDDLDLWGDRA